MPFQPLTGSFTWPSLELYAASEPCHGESVSGDGLFAEVGRRDGGLMLLLVDVMGHGSRAAQTVSTIERNHLRHPSCQNRSPAELLSALEPLRMVARRGRDPFRPPDHLQPLQAPAAAP